MPVQDKVTTLYKLWGGIEESVLFKHAKVDEVASHIAFVLKKAKSNIHLIGIKNIKKSTTELRF